MTAPSTHTVHVSSVIGGLCDALSSRLEETKVINARSNGFGLSGELYEKYFRKPTDEELTLISKAEIMLCDAPTLSVILATRGLDFLQSLRWVQVTSAGVDLVMQQLQSEPPFMVTRSTDEASPLMMAEHVVGQIVSHERRWLDIHVKQVGKDCIGWQHFHEFRSLAQLTVGVMGLGNMGLATARALKCFGCRVHGLARVPRYPAFAAPCVDQVWYGREGLDAFLKECDYVVNLLPSTPFTRGMLGGDTLSGAAKKPVLVNVGRGDIISEADLLKALQKGWLSAALLDCTEKEPLPEDSLLWTHPRVALTPHISTIGNDYWRRRNIVNNFCDNFAKFLAGKPLDGQVDWQAGY